MNPVLTEILESKKVYDENGSEHVLDSAIDEYEIDFIDRLIKEKKLVKSIEIGCAMGISSLAICQAIYNNSVNGHHVIIDPSKRKIGKI